MTRINLASDPSLRSGTTASFTALNGATLAYTADYAFYGLGALEVTKSADNGSGVSTLTAIPVVAGKPYAAAVYVRLPLSTDATQAGLTIQVEWRNSLNAVVSTDQSTTLNLADTTDWARLGGVWTAPAGATVAYIAVVQILGGEEDAVFLFDALLFEQNHYVGGYFDNLTQGETNAAVNKAFSAGPQVINGLVLNADVNINDLILNTIDEFGTIWICTGIDGWWGQSAPESPNIPRGTEDGDYDVSGRYQARYITVTGVMYPSSVANLNLSRDRLIKAINLSRVGGWFRTYEDPTKAAFVRLNGAPQIITTNERGKTQFNFGLKAGDPVKYHWDDSDPLGFSHSLVAAATTDATTVENVGTSDVTAVFTITGPLGVGTYIRNAATDETLTIVKPLRGTGAIGDITSASVTSNVATLTTSTAHHLLIGDEIDIVNTGSPYDSASTPFVVTAASSVLPHTFSYSLASDDLAESSGGGQVQLVNNDVLVVDTYDRSVSYNGSTEGQRSKLKTLTDWVTLVPGDNLIEFTDAVDPITITNKSTSSDDTSTLTATDTHYLIPGESVVVDLSETLFLQKKSLTSNVATLTTDGAHGYSITDLITVSSVQSSIIVNKVASATEATITTQDDPAPEHGVSASDTIDVDLPTSAVGVTKALTSNVVTITTQQAHGFSAEDSVTVTLNALATVSNKSLTGNQASLTTSAVHYYQINDSMTVELPTDATIVSKARSGSQAIITCDSAHGFSVGDSVAVAMATSAALSDTRSIGGSAGDYLVTLTTGAAHKFVVGDSLTVDVGLVSVQAVSDRASSGTTRTLTTATHGWSEGDRIEVTGVTADYNGTFYLTAVTGTTIEYTATDSLTESSTPSSGSTANRTITSSYDGSGKIVESVPTSTTFTYLAYGQDVATSSTTAGAGPTLTNNTNVLFNGTKTLTSASGTQFAYNI